MLGLPLGSSEATWCNAGIYINITNSSRITASLRNTLGWTVEVVNIGNYMDLAGQATGHSQCYAL